MEEPPYSRIKVYLMVRVGDENWETVSARIKNTEEEEE